jgi:threonylcarbamoyladenosine tRNA methylthiotransferase MtaB
MKIHLRTLGCRLNQAEIDGMARQFTQHGHAITDAAAEADVYVVNTCAVTQEAVRSSRQLIHRLHRANPAAQIAVTGCYAHLAPRDAASIPGVTQVIDNAEKGSLVSLITGQSVAAPELHDLEPLQRRALIGALGKTRAFIKAQDGCDRHCSFCVTRLARGAGRSRALAEIVAEVQALSAFGYREVVLTGVHLGSYGHDLDQAGQAEAVGLERLIRAILSDTDIPRLRLSSLEPWGISAGFFRLWGDARLGRHLHLPLQSGCDTTLRRMIRRTSQREFRAIVEAARAVAPDMAITTDVIVGFPGETDAEFATSRGFIEDMQFAGMHIFRYSKRPGTAAVRLPGHVSEAVMKARSDELHAIASRDERRFAERYVGSTATILWEAVSGATEAGYLNNGYTGNFIRVRSIAPHILTDQITAAHLVAWDADAGVMQARLSLR